MFSRFPARLPLATVKALVPVAVAASLLMATGLVQAAAPTAGFDWSPTRAPHRAVGHFQRKRRG